MAAPKDVFQPNPDGNQSVSRLTTGISATDILGIRGERTYLDAWKNYPTRIRKYEAGSYPSSDNPLYEYPAGEDLWMNGHLVMGTCERPWAEMNVRKAVEQLSMFRHGPQEHPSLFVVQGGFGLGMESEMWINQMFAGAVRNTDRGGTLFCFELNQKNAEYGNKALETKMGLLKRDIARARGSVVDLDAKVFNMDIQEGLQGLKQEMDAGLLARKADVISLDLFDPEQQYGTTDLLYMDLVRDCLSDTGVFTFFAYDKDTGASLNDFQRRILSEYGFNFLSSSVPVFPNPEYEYLFRTDAQGNRQPVRELEVITAWKKPGRTPLPRNSAA